MIKSPFLANKSQESPKNIKKKKSDIAILQTRCEEMTHLFKEIKKPAKEIEAISEILQKLLMNMINEPENEKFRNIKKSNEKLKKTIFANNPLMKITELCGFSIIKEKTGDLFRNGLDIANLKIIKSDLDLAIRNFMKSNENL